MKSLFFSIVLISLCSCGRSTNSESLEESGKSSLELESKEAFARPQLNTHKAVTIDYSIAPVFEDLSFAQDNEKNILGDKPFYVNLNQVWDANTFEMKLGFYPYTKIKSLLFFETRTSLALENVRKENISSFKLKDVQDYYQNELTWGKRNLDSVGSDMLNKAYVIVTEQNERKDGHEYTSLATLLVWFECSGKVTFTSDLVYKCSKYNLKLHYKLLDYELKKI